ncbi:immunity 52 family protein [Paraburkholderia sp. 22099]|uniref:immunity 52 family protein n=1 Tax=Paraburkholderia sp. 22099 TaxID=3453875 RepID=UPI003F854939
MYLTSQHRDSETLRKADFEFHLRRLRPVIDLLAEKDAKLGGDWFLGGSSIADAQRFPIFNGSTIRTEVIDELRRKNADDIDDAKFIGIWNEDSQKGCGGSIEFCIDSTVFSNTFELTVNEMTADTSRLGNYKSAAEVVEKVIEIYTPSNLTFGPRKYQGKQVFEDRPSVSWMLYLPHALTAAQVPEARALIPVVRDDKQLGTIIVSVTDDVFDVNNRDHVKAANDIEIRLADQDLLPRFVDL